MKQLDRLRNRFQITRNFKRLARALRLVVLLLMLGCQGMSIIWT